MLTVYILIYLITILMVLSLGVLIDQEFEKKYNNHISELKSYINENMNGGRIRWQFHYSNIKVK